MFPWRDRGLCTLRHAVSPALYVPAVRQWFVVHSGVFLSLSADKYLLGVSGIVLMRDAAESQWRRVPHLSSQQRRLDTSAVAWTGPTLCEGLIDCS